MRRVWLAAAAAAAGQPTTSRGRAEGATNGGELCADTPLLAGARLLGAHPLPVQQAHTTTTAVACKQSCCDAHLCVAWTFTAASGDCSLYQTRGRPVDAGDPAVTSALRAMSVPPSGWPQSSWDAIPLFTYTSNASGLLSDTALANLSAHDRYPVTSLDWEVR